MRSLAKRNVVLASSRCRIVFYMLALIATCAHAQDVVHFHSGDSFDGKTLSTNEEWVEFNVIIDGPRGRGESCKRLPRKDVAFIDFEQTEENLAIVEGKRSADVEKLRRLWVRHESYLAEANSPAGSYGILLAEQWLASGEDHARAALLLLDKIISADWDDVRRSRAQQRRLKALVLTGRAEEAKKAATRLLEETTDPQVTVEARQVLGYAAFDALKELVEAHPRWMEDDEIFSQRHALFHEAIDHFLYGSLFQGALREPAASGLWQVCEVYLHGKMPDKAKSTAEDLLKLYPESNESGLARQLLDEASPKS